MNSLPVKNQAIRNLEVAAKYTILKSSFDELTKINGNHPLSANSLSILQTAYFFYTDQFYRANFTLANSFLLLFTEFNFLSRISTLQTLQKPLSAITPRANRSPIVYHLRILDEDSAATGSHR